MNNLINVNGKKYRQLQRRTAKRFFNEGNTIYLSPCNVNLNSPWSGLTSIDNSELELYGNNIPDYLQDLFNKRINEFIYYNCTAESGRYPHFYILNK